MSAMNPSIHIANTLSQEKAFGAICPHCGTFFKVYPDQMRMHNGFANCGQCEQTFDVITTLIHLPKHDTEFLGRSPHTQDELPVLNARVTVNYQPHTTTGHRRRPIETPPSEPTDLPPPITTTPITTTPTHQDTAPSIPNAAPPAPSYVEEKPIAPSLEPQAEDTTTPAQEATTITAPLSEDNENNHIANHHDLPLDSDLTTPHAAPKQETANPNTDTESHNASDNTATPKPEPIVTRVIPQAILDNQIRNNALPSLQVVSSPDLPDTVTLNLTDPPPRRFRLWFWLWVSICLLGIAFVMLGIWAPHKLHRLLELLHLPETLSRPLSTLIEVLGRLRPIK